MSFLKSYFAAWVLRRILCATLLAAFFALAAQDAFAQSFSIDWFKIAGGGGASSGGSFSVIGTIGQIDANHQPMTGGGFALKGGFLSIYTEQTIAAPLLSIRLSSPDTVQVYWPSPSVGFKLQMNTDLSTANWVAPAEDVTDDGAIRYININSPADTRFYRLASP
jgi:hypothetical protein